MLHAVGMKKEDLNKAQAQGSATLIPTGVLCIAFSNCRVWNLEFLRINASSTCQLPRRCYISCLACVADAVLKRFRCRFSCARLEYAPFGIRATLATCTCCLWATTSRRMLTRSPELWPCTTKSLAEELLTIVCCTPKEPRFKGCYCRLPNKWARSGLLGVDLARLGAFPPCPWLLLSFGWDSLSKMTPTLQDPKMYGFQFNTIGVSDGMSMGTKGMMYSLPSRESCLQSTM